MKKLHTLLAGLTLCVCMLAACSSCKDDEPGEGTPTYDTTKGYTTNMASVKHGIVGRWSDGVTDISYNAAGEYFVGTSLDQTLSKIGTYSLVYEDGYFINYLPTGNSHVEKYKLIQLNKTGLKTQSISSGSNFLYSRVSTAPNP